MAGRIFRYGLVGLSGVGVNLVILTVARFLWPHWVTVTYLLAVEASIVTNYLLNARFTFRQPSNLRGLGQYNAVSAAGGLLQTAVYRMLLHWGWLYIPADLVAIPFATAFGFLLANVWVFRTREVQHGSHAVHSVRTKQRTGSDR
ncbi:MAG: GtrA family protein [Thermaerobacter sp.]|nr:GtrA family protein [Thermaerobacter sp.]